MKVKWTELYDTEDDLVLDMVQTKSDVKRFLRRQIVKEYKLIESLKICWLKNELTSKQIDQLKPLAKDIYTNVRSYERKFIIPENKVSYGPLNKND